MTLLQSWSYVTLDIMENSLATIGHCATCRFLHVIKSARGNFFVMCNLSKTDSEFEKYPTLPVYSCDGYHQVDLSKSVDNENQR